VTVAEALSAIRQVGTVESYAGNLRLRFPKAAVAELQRAIDTLRGGKTEALALLSDPDAVELAGVRNMAVEVGATIGVWSDLDGIRAPIRALGSDHVPVGHLDGPGIPTRYKPRRVPDHEQSVSWAEWRAAALNRLFQQQGTSRQPGRITPATILDGERRAAAILYKPLRSR
jgi:hypothetical protein